MLGGVTARRLHAAREMNGHRFWEEERLPRPAGATATGAGRTKGVRSAGSTNTYKQLGRRRRLADDVLASLTSATMAATIRINEQLAKHVLAGNHKGANG